MFIPPEWGQIPPYSVEGVNVLFLPSSSWVSSQSGPKEGSSSEVCTPRSFRGGRWFESSLAHPSPSLLPNTSRSPSILPPLRLRPITPLTHVGFGSQSPPARQGQA